MGGRFYDFDAARAERQAATPPPQMLVFGEVVDLPRSTPAVVHLTAARMGAQAKVTLALLVELLGACVGADRVARWLDEHPDLEEDDIRDLYYGALDAINQAEDAEGEGPPPAPGESPGASSPSTGGPSKPTSPASTTSTPPPPSGTT